MFAWFRGEARFLAALWTVAVLIAIAIFVYAIRIRFRFREDWRGLSPREIGVRVYSTGLGKPTDPRGFVATQRQGRLRTGEEPDDR